MHVYMIYIYILFNTDQVFYIFLLFVFQHLLWESGYKEQLDDRDDSYFPLVHCYVNILFY